MDKDEKQHYNRLAAFGCCVCHRMGFGKSMAEIHHIRTTAGAGQKSHWSTAIPLCPMHHRNGGYGIAYHAGRKEFEKRYGTEVELLEWTLNNLEYDK